MTERVIKIAFCILCATAFVWAVGKPNESSNINGEWLSINFDAEVELSNICIGAIEIDTKTGRITLPEGMVLDDASKEFWDNIEYHFKNNAKIAMRLQLWSEIQSEHIYRKRTKR